MEDVHISNNLNQEQLTQAIREKASQLFEQSGRKPGRDLDNWLRAERIVKEQIRRSFPKNSW